MNLFDSKLVTMQRLQSAAHHHTHWTAGDCTLDAFEKMSAKFARNYGVDDSKFVKCRHRKKGFAVSSLIAWRHKPGRVHWWLLCNEGRGKVWANEKLDLIAEKRVSIFGGYELVHDGKTWSWKYRESHLNSLRESARQHIIKRNDEALQALINQIFQTAGFRMAREQVGSLAAGIKSDWKRLRKSTEPPPIFPLSLPYVRRMPHQQKRERVTDSLTKFSTKEKVKNGTVSAT